MSIIRKYYREPAPRRRLLVRTFFLLALMRVLTWLTPFRWVKTRVGIWGALNKTATPPPRAEIDIAWAVRQAARIVPGAACLPQALTGFILWRRRGLPVEWRLGVAKESDTSASSHIKAHAWVELDGRILLGDWPEHEVYQTLPSLEANSTGDET